MLTCYGHEIRLPHSDLAYLAFRLAVQETLSDIELFRDLEEEPEVAAAYLRGGPRQLKTRILRRAAHRLDDMFDAFWDDDDFLLIDELQDLPPKRSAEIRARMLIADEDVQSLYDALGRWHVSPSVAANLRGLLTDAEIADAMPLLTDPWLTTDDADTKLLTGIDDSYHGLSVGPCDPETAAAEAAKCHLVCEIGVTDAEDFECSYQVGGGC